MSNIFDNFINLPWNGIFNVFQQVLSTIFLAAGVCIAWLGLNTWRRQLKGSHDFDLSRRLLLSIYKCRDALKAARGPFVQPGEASKGRDDWEESAYENRWKIVDESMRETRASILESEVAWGEDFKNEFSELHRLVIRLMLATKHYLNNKSERGRSSASLFSKEDESILWGVEGDEYSKKLEDTIKKFEDKIKPNLDRK